MKGHYHYDGEEWCEECLPVSPNSSLVDLDQGEQDYPASCYECGRVLDYSLTADGVTGVLKELVEAIENKEYESIEPGKWPEGSYYTGCPQWEMEWDWAEDLKCHYLNKIEQFVLDRFFELFKPAHEKFTRSLSDDIK